MLLVTKFKSLLLKMIKDSNKMMSTSRQEGLTVSLWRSEVIRHTADFANQTWARRGVSERHSTTQRGASESV